MFWSLGQRVQSRVFQQQSVLDILKQVLVSDWQLDVRFITVLITWPLTDCVQYRESDLAFRQPARWSRKGSGDHFRHTESGHTAGHHGLVVGRYRRAESAQAWP